MNFNHKPPVIALFGNPNSGKSSLFNFLTGLRQKVSNFPGVTVDKKLGKLTLEDHTTATVIDYPGTYSVFPNSSEEKIVVNALTNENYDFYPDLALYIADATQLERHLLFASQIRDLGIPMIFILNMADLLREEGSTIDADKIADFLQCEVITVSMRKNENTIAIKKAISKILTGPKPAQPAPLYPMTEVENRVAAEVQQLLGIKNKYQAKIIAHHFRWLTHISVEQKAQIEDIVNKHGFVDLTAQVNETMTRFDRHGHLVRQAVNKIHSDHLTLTDRIDAIITHKVFGPIVFFLIMLFVFQAIFSWAEWPMTWIENGFAIAGSGILRVLGDGWWADLLVNGVLAGLSGVLVFIPQIAILFFLIGILEESGYMSRVVYMFDSIMQRFGMNGRSMVALISSGACAIPAIMSTRTISNQKERLITIMVSPLISCSARLPVYAILVGFVVPAERIGIFQLQGLAFMGLYLLGILGALAAAYIMKKVVKGDAPSYLMIEMPNYKPPQWSNVWMTVKTKVGSFITEAGRIILLISIVLWFLASYGPGQSMQQAEENALAISTEQQLDENATENLIAAQKLESSYIGHIGKWIEPAIKPLGYDWKIGIALMTSFAAREVFVGTMATIYSIGSESDEMTIRQKMAAELKPGTNQKMYDRATALSLLIFYVFAMQCMSTLAVTKKETNTWKWPVIMFTYMGVMAYVGAFIAYQIFS
ncbi:MAG: ferrous iron transport protein B [Saprospiraceae bacterium]|nr:MAG: ferrous iron transport protein B [Bacteroidetes bacterium OLB9]MCO6463977.1 ferrous iron transport protein B [Saprospiraceae bacterium]MCZ2339444.1 ferrous iron transport protein B [Chitinophagales bacterium]